MLALRSKDNRWLSSSELPGRAILRVTVNRDLPGAVRSRHALLVDEVADAANEKGFGATLVRGAPQTVVPDLPAGVLALAPELGYLGEGDVVRIAPSAKISVFFRKNANAHSVLLTERCNSFCVMCSQPPRDVDDGYIVDDVLEAIPLFDRATTEVGFTGGEPTLLGPRLFELIRATKSYLPHAALHILSNGRNFANLGLARDVAAIGHPDLMIGIPLYSDVPAIHDFVVQADGAFDETVRGILNLKRCGVRVEIRVVIHRHTVDRLPELARFIARNLLFADHVALMGLELMGFARSNLDDLWIDPFDYRETLQDAAQILDRAGMRVSIYNHQLCVLTPAARHFSVKSISDWKNEFMSACDGCGAKPQCGGFFSSASLRYSAHITPLPDATDENG